MSHSTTSCVDRGFVEGQNLLVDTQGYELRVNQLAEHAAALVTAKVDAIICAGNAAVRAGQQATKTVPILAISNDMVGQGFVRSLTNPEGNITGFSLLATVLDGKRQEILIDLVPWGAPRGVHHRPPIHVATASSVAPGSGAHTWRRTYDLPGFDSR